MASGTTLQCNMTANEGNVHTDILQRVELIFVHYSRIHSSRPTLRDYWRCSWSV